MLSRRTLLVAGIAAIAASGCAHQQPFVPADQLAASQRRAQELFAENRELQFAREGSSQLITGLQAEQERLFRQLTESDQRLATANTRIENFLAERSELEDHCRTALVLPYDDSVLMSKYMSDILGFDYDRVTGLHKFPQDLLFDLGSAELKPEMTPVMKEFVEAADSFAAAGVRILIVGHTDDQRIARAVTTAKHATNWHLSTDRADGVIAALARLGIDEERMAAMGYGRFQPLEASVEESARQRNRRVELYLVPAAGSLAQWDPGRSLR